MPPYSCSDISDDENIEELPDNSDDLPGLDQQQSGDGTSLNNSRYVEDNNSNMPAPLVNRLDGVNHDWAGLDNKKSLDPGQQQQSGQPIIYFEDFDRRTEEVQSSTAKPDSSTANNSWRPEAGERVEIYKARTLEDINLIYSAQTLLSTRHGKGSTAVNIQGV
jgi:hypothetical protein